MSKMLVFENTSLHFLNDNFVALSYSWNRTLTVIKDTSFLNTGIKGTVC